MPFQTPLFITAMREPVDSKRKVAFQNKSVPEQWNPIKANIFHFVNGPRSEP